jgi:mannose-6-phosphate isomerase-like protein (cupin superfamily)
MPGFKTNIEKDTVDNKNYRKVLFTSKYSQLVLMSLKPGEEIGEEIHKDSDQFFRFEKGEGNFLLDKETFKVTDGSAVIVPIGINHNVINTSKTENLQLYAIYSPPQHKDKIIHKNKEDDKEHIEEQNLRKIIKKELRKI